jgi:hypothetical protein
MQLRSLCKTDNESILIATSYRLQLIFTVAAFCLAIPLLFFANARSLAAHPLLSDNDSNDNNNNNNDDDEDNDPQIALTTTFITRRPNIPTFRQASVHCRLVLVVIQFLFHLDY